MRFFSCWYLWYAPPIPTRQAVRARGHFLMFWRSAFLRRAQLPNRSRRAAASSCRKSVASSCFHSLGAALLLFGEHRRRIFGGEQRIRQAFVVRDLADEPLYYGLAVVLAGVVVRRVDPLHLAIIPPDLFFRVFVVKLLVAVNESFADRQVSDHIDVEIG